MPTQQNLVQKVCTMCGETKATDEFKRLLTLRQSAHLLQRPTQRRLTVISSRCKSCWHKAKRKTPLTLKDIQRKKVSGDLHPVVADLMTKELRKAIPERRARVMKEYWHKKKQEPIKQLKTNLQQQVAKYYNRLNAYRATKITPNNEATYHALLRQHKENYEQAKQIRDALMKRANEGEAIDPNTLIAEHFKTRSNDV